MRQERSVTDWIRRSILRACDMLPPITAEEIEANLRDVRDRTFDALRNNRLRMGYVRYESRVGCDQNIGYAQRADKAIDDYWRTGNKEFLVDAANYIEREWQCPSFERTYFEALDHPEGKP